MNRQVVLEIGNSTVKAGFIEVSSLPIKTFSSWGSKDSLKQGKKFFGNEVEVFDDNLHLRALKNSELNDLDFLIELIEYSMCTELEISRESFDQVQLTLVLPSQLIALQLPLRSKLIKTIYERLNVAGVFLAEVACMAALGSAHGTALVLNFESEGVEVGAVNDFALVTSAVEYFPIGSSSFLKELIKSSIPIAENPKILKSYDPNNDPSDPLPKFTSTTTTTSTIIDETFTIPIETFIEAFKKVFVESCGLNLNLIDVIESVLERVDFDRRSITLNHIIINGNFIIPYPIICSCLQSILISSPILSISDYPADFQPTAISFRSIPEYYNEIKDRGNDSIAWFGASLTGKYAHSDSKTFIPPKKDKESN